MIDNDSQKGSDGVDGHNELTGSPGSIHWPATHEGDGDLNEADQVSVNTFLDTLARIALAVASRGGAPDDKDEAVNQ